MKLPSPARVPFERPASNPPRPKSEVFVYAKTAVHALLVTLLLVPAAVPVQAQSFNAGSYFFGRNVTSDLPLGVADLSDHLFASETYTCALVFIGTKAQPQTQLMCRQHVDGAKVTLVVADGDPRLRGTRLAYPTTAKDDTARYLTSLVRPEKTNLYFTTVTNGPQGFSHQVAWRYRNYATLDRVAGVGDTVTIKLVNGQTQMVTLSVAGPIDASSDSREFIYLESTSILGNVDGIFELLPSGVFNLLFQGRIPAMRESPWGFGGFAFADGGVAFKQGVTLYLLDPNTRGLSGWIPGFPYLAQEGSPFSGDPKRFPNLGLAQMFRRPVPSQLQKTRRCQPPGSRHYGFVEEIAQTNP